MVDVFISYPQRERALMLPIKQRLEALGLILFVDVDGRLDGEATFPEALDKGVRASKAVLGCWSPWALTRPWVQTECAIGKDENKLVAVERVALTVSEVPALFYLVERKPLTDFDGDAPHEGWAMTLSALATKLKLWVEKRPDHPEAAPVRDKIAVLEKAAVAERAALDGRQLAREPGGRGRQAAASDAAERAWAAIERSVEVSHYRRFERTFESDPAAFVRVIEAEARAKALERWAATDRQDADAIAETLRTGLFPALQDVAERALATAEEAARHREDAAARQRAEDERVAREQAEAARCIVAWKAEGRIRIDGAIFAPRDSEAAQAGWLKPGAGKTEWFKDLDIGPQMVVVPPGSFEMGSTPEEIAALKKEYPASAEYFDWEAPRHRVTIAKPFAVSVGPVSRGEFAAFVTATRRDMSGGAYGWTGSEWKRDATYSWQNPGFAQSDDHPVLCVNWDDAQAYAEWLTGQTGGKVYRLLTEAEWEYCCRATTDTAYSTGTSITRAQANFGRNEKGTTPIGKYPPNAWGLTDMHGNAWEWVTDGWHASYKDDPPKDGSEWKDGADTSSRVLRGGSWSGNPGNLRSAIRLDGRPDFRYNHIGFRVARTL